MISSQRSPRFVAKKYFFSFVKGGNKRWPFDFWRGKMNKLEEETPSDKDLNDYE